MIRSRTDAVEFVRRVGKLAYGLVIHITTPLGNTLVVFCAPKGASWTKRVEAPDGSAVTAEEVIHDPAGWVYANRKAVNAYFRQRYQR